jgi:hypothetical protein
VLNYYIGAATTSRILLKFPNGQFPLKIPGPISQAKPKPMKKNLPPKKKSKLNGGVVILLKNRLVNLITFLANRIRLVVAAPI